MVCVVVCWFLYGDLGTISMATVLDVYKSVCCFTALHMLSNLRYCIYSFCTIYWCYSLLCIQQFSFLLWRPLKVGTSIYCGKGTKYLKNKSIQIRLGSALTSIKIWSNCEFIAVIMKGMSSGRKRERERGRVERSFYSKGWVISLLSTNLQLLNIQNNFGLNQVIQWSRVKS